MNLYSHLYLASCLQTHLQPADPPEYLWGAVCPDIRYLTGMPRDRTHIPIAQIDEIQRAHPQLDSFLAGFRVHCLLDEISLPDVLGRALPLRLFRLKQRQLSVMVELHIIRTHPLKFKLSGSQNAVLAGLGVSPEQASRFAGLLNQYLDSPSIDRALAALQQFGLLDDARIQQYLRAAAAFGRNWLLQKMFSASLRRANLEQFTVGYVLSALSARAM